jgi:hypothetical protein
MAANWPRSLVVILLSVLCSSCGFSGVGDNSLHGTDAGTAQPSVATQPAATPAESAFDGDVKTALDALSAATVTPSPAALSRLAKRVNAKLWRRLRVTLVHGKGLFELSKFAVAEVESRSAKIAVIHVTREYKLRGWDTNSVTSTLTMEFRLDRGRWLLSSTGNASTTGDPWDDGGAHHVSWDGILVVGNLSERSLLLVAKATAAVVPDVRRMWPSSAWNGRVVVYASSSKPLAVQWWNGGEYRPGKSGTEATTRHIGSSGFRVAIVPDVISFVRTNRVQFQTIMRHELTHVALEAGRSCYYPIWVNEGAAEYTAYRGPRQNADQAFRRHNADRGQDWIGPAAQDLVLVTDDHDWDAAAYDPAWAAMEYIADRYGEQALRQFVLSSCTMDSTADGVDQAVGNALWSVFQASSDDIRYGTESFLFNRDDG